MHDAPVLSSSGSTRFFTLPSVVSSSSSVGTGLASQLERRKPRRFPINITAVVGPVELSSELRMTLPPGWKAELPPNVTETSQFGSFTAAYAQDGRELHVTHTMSGHKGIAPPESVDELIAWLRAVSKDDVKFIVLHPGQ